MNLRAAEEGKEYIIKDIVTDDEELDDFLFSLPKRAVFSFSNILGLIRQEASKPIKSLLPAF